MKTHATSSRLPGFYRQPLIERRRALFEGRELSESSRAQVHGGGLPLETADLMSENVVSTYGLPLSVALNFRINGRDHLVPMAIEEPSVVAAASNAARLVRLSGGFAAEVDDPIMTAQVHLSAVPDPNAAVSIVQQHRDLLTQLANEAIPRMVARRGGCRDVSARVVSEAESMIVVELFVDVRDAMGANVVDTVAEAVAPHIEALVGGTVGLRILSNLPLRRLVRARCWVSNDAIGGNDTAGGIVQASRFAELDPFRAVTHNKGIMNGVDAVAIATGQDFRAIEAGAHAYAGLGEGYRPLATWKQEGPRILGRLEMPLAVGTVGGTLRAHPGASAALELSGVTRANELAALLACVGLASNLAALRALATEGIQRGHMRLHARRLRSTSWNEQHSAAK
jgi:hydroxymethylglutaryl-CoA reductase